MRISQLFQFIFLQALSKNDNKLSSAHIFLKSLLLGLEISLKNPVFCFKKKHLHEIYPSSLYQIFFFFKSGTDYSTYQYQYGPQNQYYDSESSKSSHYLDFYNNARLHNLTGYPQPPNVAPNANEVNVDYADYYENYEDEFPSASKKKVIIRDYS